MKVLLKSIKDNRIVLSLFMVFMLFLLMKHIGEGSNRTSLFTAVWNYCTGGEGEILVSALVTTLAVAFPVSVLILCVSMILAALSYFKPKASPYISALVSFSLLPTVYLIFLLKAMINGIPVDNKLFLVCALAFSNLILFFFYMGFRKELAEEFAKEYHSFAKMLGVKSILVSSAKRIGLIVMERFRPLFIMVFSSTIFAEHKLDVAGGIYYLLYKTTTSFEGRDDIFYGQLLFILLFVVLFLLVYDSFTNMVKTRYY